MHETLESFLVLLAGCTYIYCWAYWKKWKFKIAVRKSAEALVEFSSSLGRLGCTCAESAKAINALNSTLANLSSGQRITDEHGNHIE